MKAGAAQRILRAVLMSTVLLLLMLSMLVAYEGMQEDIRRSDVAVVLGNEVHDDATPSDRLAARLDAAADLYRRGMFDNVIVSGGRGKNGVDEATAMKVYLVQQGIPAERIIADSLGVTTAATAKNTAIITRERHWSTVLVVSQYFHIPRCRLAFSRAGFTDVRYAHARYVELRDLYSTPREVVGYAAYLAGFRD